MKFLEKLNEKLDDLGELMAKNPDKTRAIIFSSGTAIVAGGFKIAKDLIRNSRSRRELNFKETHIYDRSTGMYIPIKRKMKPGEIAYFNELKKQGFRTTEILSRMKLL